MPSSPSQPGKLLAANRGEIAIRIFRAATELGLRTVSIFAEEDRFSIHRFKADEAYQLDSSKGPVGAYLDYEGIVKLAKSKGVTMIHPGYGFLSENPNFARACAKLSASTHDAPARLAGAAWRLAALITFGRKS